jgi:DNA-binding protein Fis
MDTPNNQTRDVAVPVNHCREFSIDYGTFTDYHNFDIVCEWNDFVKQMNEYVPKHNRLEEWNSLKPSTQDKIVEYVESEEFEGQTYYDVEDFLTYHDSSSLQSDETDTYDVPDGINDVLQNFIDSMDRHKTYDVYQLPLFQIMKEELDTKKDVRHQRQLKAQRLINSIQSSLTKSLNMMDDDVDELTDKLFTIT